MAEWESGEALPLDFKILHSPIKVLAKKGCFLSFETEKWNFTIFGRPSKILFGYLRKIHYRPPTWKTSFRSPCVHSTASLENYQNIVETSAITRMQNLVNCEMRSEAWLDESASTLAPVWIKTVPNIFRKCSNRVCFCSFNLLLPKWVSKRAVAERQMFSIHKNSSLVCFDRGPHHGARKTTLKWNDCASDLGARWRRLDLNQWFPTGAP